MDNPSRDPDLNQLPTQEQLTVAGVFRKRGEAENAVLELRQAGFSFEQIGIESRGVPADDVQRTPGKKSVETGSVAGGGAAGDALRGAGIVTGLSSTKGKRDERPAMGHREIDFAHHGDLSAEELRYFESAVQSGSILVTVQAADRTADALAILCQHNVVLGPELACE